jgi:hypothetical protein
MEKILEILSKTMSLITSYYDWDFTYLLVTNFNFKFLRSMKNIGFVITKKISVHCGSNFLPFIQLILVLKKISYLLELREECPS